jgi:hypothetical protein
LATNNDYWVSKRVITSGLCTYKWWEALIAEAATLARGKQLFYTTPLQPLSNQKL